VGSVRWVAMVGVMLFTQLSAVSFQLSVLRCLSLADS
jgi:hypothetical protein